MDINPSYNCLLGRPWIHLAGAVPSTLHQKLKLVTEEDIIATVTNDAPYLETNEEAIECSLEFVNATFILEGNEVPVPRISRTTRMELQMMVGKGALLGKGLGRHLQGGTQVPMLKEKKDHFGLGFRPNARQRKKEMEKKQEKRRAQLSGEEVKWELMAFPHISQTFVSGGIIHSEKVLLNNEDPHINAIHEEGTERRNLLGIHPYEPGSVLNNWTTEELPVDFEDDRDCDLPSNLLRMVEQEEKQILPHKEVVENVILEEGKVVKVGTHIDIVVHRLPIRKECKPVQQKLRRMRPDVVLKIKEEVKKHFDAGFLQVVKYSEWVANIVPVPKKNGKVRMYVDYRDLNKASPKDNFPLPHIDTLVDNTVGYSLFSFIDGFSGYNQIKMHPGDMEKNTFVTLWGTFCYKVMPFGLKNAGATYERAMVTLFHDMMHKEI
ncbi:reverse transcriptase [Gossypium australe]|uniref:Reverse transcriptase n=1 Tax=Gossypium australe TaxID=47621 RepID=A0A5B6WHB1_9ROSI|nr:reverse transcriptase [Gossypium australe]